MLSKMYNDSVGPDFTVKESYFRDVLNRNFNFGFGFPKTDACSTCLFLEEQIKTQKDSTKKSELITQRQVHKLRSNAFYEMLKSEEDEAFFMSFDCQNNLLLPRVPDQSTYFSRQFSLYNFTIVNGNSKSKLTKENVHSYTWCESEYPKNSNSISSCVYYHLLKSNLDGKTAVKCFSDGCGGQNKNTILIAMLSKWLVTDAPQEIKTVDITFPIVGHSFIPPDRVFGNVEKDLKKRDTILSPEEYEEVLLKHATVHKVGSTVPIKDWKTESEKVQKKPNNWHFKFNPCKRIIIKKSPKDPETNVIVQGEVHYRTDVCEGKCVSRPKRDMTHINPKDINRGVKLNPAKVRDVANLLKKHFGEEWQNNNNLKFYVDLNQSQQETGGHDEDDVVIIEEEIDTDII